MRGFFIDRPAAGEEFLSLTGEEHRHYSQVLRGRVGDLLKITGTDGVRVRCSVESIHEEETILKVIDELVDETENKRTRLTLFQALPKSGKQELIVQKGTELGMSSYRPFVSGRCVAKPGKGDAKKRERLSRIAREAAKQSGRGSVPQVFEPVSFEELTKELSAYDLILLAYEKEEEHSLKDVLLSYERQVGPGDRPISIALLIGPEGGFDADEVNALIDAGAKSFTFGKRILRTETAGLVALSQINYQFDEG